MSLLEQGINKIYDECLEEQTHFINTICKNIRGRYLDILFDMKAFYVPNDEFMIEYFGPAITSSNYDCYDYYGSCKWKYHLVIPIRDVYGNTVGFSGYNPYVSIAKNSINDSSNEDTSVSCNELETVSNSELSPSNIYNNESLNTNSVADSSKDNSHNSSDNSNVLKTLPKYKESSIVLMDKSKFFICPLGLKKSIDDEYIILVDGVFDSISLAQEGYNSISILGSTISEYNRFILSLVKNVYVAYDNDGAGRRLYESLKRIHSNVYSITQSKCKDIDDFIKQYPDDFKREMSKLSSKVPMSFHLKVE